MIYAVLDTNVLVSAHISRNPHAATIKVISFMLKGIITPIYNEEILCEYHEDHRRSAQWPQRTLLTTGISQ